MTTLALGVAVNVCREQLRKRQPSVAQAELLDSQPSRSEEPAVRLAILEAGQQVRRLVQQLPGRQGEAVTLRYLEQLSVAETAEAMGCSEGAVKASAWQGLRSLRTKLEGMR